MDTVVEFSLLIIYEHFRLHNEESIEIMCKKRGFTLTERLGIALFRP